MKCHDFDLLRRIVLELNRGVMSDDEIPSFLSPTYEVPEQVITKYIQNYRIQCLEDALDGEYPEIRLLKFFYE